MTTSHGTAIIARGRSDQCAASDRQGSQNHQAGLQWCLALQLLPVSKLVKAMGFTPQNITLCDTKGVIYKGRTEGMNQWKSGHAIETKARTLADAMDGADIVLGLSAKGALTPEMVASMAKKPDHFCHGQS